MVRRRDRGPLYSALVAVAIGAVVIGAGAVTHWYGLVPGSPSGACPTGVTLQGEGASFPAALVSQWVEEFGTATGDQVNYAPAGAGLGISQLTSKLVDFALTDEPLTVAETTALVAAVGTVLTLPLTGGAVSLVYNLPSYSGPLNLTAAEAAAIYNGSIVNWNAATLVANNPGLSGIAASIDPVERTDAAGMSYVLTDFLSEDVPWWSTHVGTSIQPGWPSVAHAVGVSGNSALLKEVASQTGAIGYTDLYDAESHQLPRALVENPDRQYVAPSPQSAGQAVNDTYAADPGAFPASNASWAGVSFVNAAGSGDYPLATLVYGIVPQDPARGFTASAADAAILVEWLNWTLTTGESFNATQFPYVNPPGPLASEALAALSTMNYNGAAIPTCR